MQQSELYEAILSPVASKLGPFDSHCLTAIVGFGAGGPISLLTIGRGQRQPFVTYVTCELAVREDQVPSDGRKYELLVTCDDEDWSRAILTKVGQMTTEVAFGDGHTLDIGPWVGMDDHVQGLAFEGFCQTTVGEEQYAVFRLHGLTRDELNLARDLGVEEVLARHRSQGLYPRTHVPQPHKSLEL